MRVFGCFNYLKSLPNGAVFHKGYCTTAQGWSDTFYAANPADLVLEFRGNAAQFTRWGVVPGGTVLTGRAATIAAQEESVR